MSKDFFKVKKGLHIKPSDPSTLTDLEDGDIIVDSTDNQLKKYSEADGEFATIAGSGGLVANFFSDFDKLAPTLDQASVADDSVVFLPIDDNKKSKKITYTAAGSALYEVAASADLEGAQGLMTIWIKTDVQGVTVSTTTDGVKQSTLSVLATGKWKQYEIPYIVGGTNQGLIVESANAGDVNIDEPFVGLAPAGYIQDVGQAYHVGSLTWQETPSCLWTSTSTSYVNFGDVASCDDNARVVEGNVLDSSSGLKPEITIPNARTDGTYKVLLQGAFYKAQSNNNACIYRLSGQDNFQNTFQIQDNNGIDFSPGGTFDVRFNTSGSKTLNVQTLSTTGDNCHIDARTSTFQISVEFFPDASSTIVAQDTELTAATANEFVATISSSGVVSNENFDWLNGDCTSTATGNWSCNFNPGIFSAPPVCNVNFYRAADSNASSVDRVAFINFIDTNKVFYGLTSNGTLVNVPATLTCHRSSDYNKSATIVGKFEQIGTTDLCQIDAHMSQSQLIRKLLDDIPFHTEITDNCNIFNANGNSGSNDSINPTRDSYWSIAGYIQPGLNINRLSIYKDGIEIKGCGVSEGNTTSLAFACIVDMKAGSKYTFRVSSFDFTTSNNTILQRLTATELPNTEAIVKNLLAESSQTKCQTKYLSGNVNSPGVIALYNFDNLVVGKKYELFANTRVSTGGSSVLITEYRNGTDLIFTNKPYANNSASSTSAKRIFTASSTSISVNATNASASIVMVGDTTPDDSYMTLCQLPDTVLDTEEF